MRRILLPFLVLLVVACQPAVPPSISAVLGQEFPLAVGQTVTLSDAILNLTLINIPRDDRCPFQIECAGSGPVTVTISVRLGAEPAQEFNFLTFTDNEGSVPVMEFEGMTTQVDVGDYMIQVKGILPYPQLTVAEISSSDYRVTFVVTKK